ncbi:MAG: hypothetical protein JXA06_00720 [Bacteroidetes bacterium]|nr:hypothetical protein [Bacteroidota bacterium]
MKKVISCILVLSLVLVVTVSAMPSTQNSSVKMTDTQMMQSVGGWDGWACLGDIAYGGFMGGCAGSYFGFYGGLAGCAIGALYNGWKSEAC